MRSLCNLSTQLQKAQQDNTSLPTSSKLLQACIIPLSTLGPHPLTPGCLPPPQVPGGAPLGGVSKECRKAAPIDALSKGKKLVFLLGTYLF